MSTLPAQKSAAPAKSTSTKSIANKVITAKSASLSPAKTTVNLPVKAPLTSKPVVANKKIISSKATISGTTKPAANATLKSAVQLKPKLGNGKKDNTKKNNGSKDNNQNKKNDHNDDKKNEKKDDKKDDKKIKTEKVKMERDSFTMPKDEYAQLALLKGRLTAMGQPAKKSELLRAGIKLLAAMSDNTLKTTLTKVPVIKTGRPNK